MLSKWFCFFFGHKYMLAQELSAQSRRVTCARCTQSFAMNDDVRALVPWDAGFHKMYESLGVCIVYQPRENKPNTEESAANEFERLSI